MGTNQTSETVLINGHPVNLSYQQPEGKVLVTIAPDIGPGKTLYTQLRCGAQRWVNQLRNDLYVCKSRMIDRGSAIVLELDCPEKQDAVIYKLNYLSEDLRLAAEAPCI